MIIKYFLRANTATGEANLIYDNLKGIKDIIVIEGKSRKAKKKLFARIASVLDERGKSIEGIMSPFDVLAYEGLIIREDGVAILDERCARNIKGERMNLDRYQPGKLSAEDEELLIQKAKTAYDNLYEAYSQAKKIHDQWERIYVENMDFDALNGYTDGVISQLILSRKGSLEGQRRTGFFGASTPDGSVNYIGGITENISKRYFIKGRPGTGKSTFLKKLAAVTEKNGYDTEVYYCSFDRNSLDMVVVRDLDFAVFDSTAPHQVFPERDGDRILDFYTESGLSGTDEAFESQLEWVSGLYANKIRQGIANLRLGLCYESELEFYYEQMTDEDSVCIAADKIVRKIP